MPRRKLEERATRKLMRLGNSETGSIVVSIPIEIIRELRWREGQRVVVRKINKNITIRDWKK